MMQITYACLGKRTHIQLFVAQAVALEVPANYESASSSTETSSRLTKARRFGSTLRPGPCIHVYATIPEYALAEISLSSSTVLIFPAMFAGTEKQFNFMNNIEVEPKLICPATT